MVTFFFLSSCLYRPSALVTLLLSVSRLNEVYVRHCQTTIDVKLTNVITNVIGSCVFCPVFCSINEHLRNSFPTELTLFVTIFPDGLLFIRSQTVAQTRQLFTVRNISFSQQMALTFSSSNGFWGGKITYAKLEKYGYNIKVF